jgi:flagellar motor switch protein FliM
MSEQNLSKEDIDSLLSAVDEGKISSAQAEKMLGDSGGSGSGAIKYDLLSQDRIIRGRLPTLDIINDRFARQLRITLSNSIRKVMQVSVENTTLMKYGEFLNYLPAPSCLNIVRFQPLRGSCIVTIEAKLIYAFLNNFFGGVTNPKEKLEGRDFTAVESMIIRKLMGFILQEYDRCWQPVYQINSEYLRTETNPQFLTVVPLSDVVLVTSFEIEMENLRGMVQIVIPYSTVEPIRHHLTSGIQSEDDEVSISWYDQIEYQLQDSEVELDVLLGRAQLTVEQMLDLKVGDVLMLNQNQNTPLKLRIEETEKYLVEPVERSGVISVKVVESIVKPPAPESNKSHK